MDEAPKAVDLGGSWFHGLQDQVELMRLSEALAHLQRGADGLYLYDVSLPLKLPGCLALALTQLISGHVGPCFGGFRRDLHRFTIRFESVSRIRGCWSM